MKSYVEYQFQKISEGSSPMSFSGGSLFLHKNGRIEVRKNKSVIEEMIWEIILWKRIIY